MQVMEWGSNVRVHIQDFYLINTIKESVIADVLLTAVQCH